jgi:hypothetical protein
MKRRVRKIVNFFAFNLLFFALYLNFIHNDKVVAATVTASESNQANNTNTAAFSGTVLVSNPEQYLQKKNEVSLPAVQDEATAVETKAAQTSGEPLRLSIN